MVAHYGSAAAEIAVCTKAVGLVERSELSLLRVEGAEPVLAHALEGALPGAVPSAGEAACVADTWCARVTPGLALVAGVESAVDRWRSVVGRAVATTGIAVTATVLEDGDAASVVGPRAEALIGAVGLPAELAPWGVEAGELDGCPVVVVREDSDSFLLMFTAGCPDSVRRAIEEGGRAVGLVRVGHDALTHLRAARRGNHPPAGSRALHG